jgi:hypothetical protein
MTRTVAPSLFLTVAALALAGCPGDDAPPSPNPSRLWLALDGSELQVRLVPVQPPPF